ncbi:DNA-binding protein [Oceanobacillus sp. E9]|uniref:helix-turn-helix domain-containing protein n=1 Tax=Oceanobacillus sp. E9 TaxID=1742575 RepID=UPI00084E6704|nr:helix-turn-helix transcriptional regulator [Oceanobacillus sp. E9]OEH53022.1 DNA-binding protein [Oceanobacillus sp. E9]
MTNYTEFGAEARKLMLKKSITLTSLAKELGISVTYVSEILKGTRAGDKYRNKIAEIIGMEE